MDEAAVDNAVSWSRRLHPSVSISKEAPYIYAVNDRRVELRLENGIGLVAIDGPLRQPLADYIACTGDNETWTDSQHEQSSLHSIPLASRISFEEVFPVSRAEAMEAALQEAEARERHAQFLASIAHSIRNEGMTSPPRAPSSGQSPVGSPLVSQRGLAGINDAPDIQLTPGREYRGPVRGLSIDLPLPRLRSSSPSVCHSPPLSPQRQPPRTIGSPSFATGWASPHRLPMSRSSSSQSIALPQQRYAPMRSSSAPALLDISRASLQRVRCSSSIGKGKVLFGPGSSTPLSPQVPLSGRASPVNGLTQEQRIMKPVARYPMPIIQSVAASSHVHATVPFTSATLPRPLVRQDGFRSPAPRRSAFPLFSSPHPSLSVIDSVAYRTVAQITEAMSPRKVVRADDSVVLSDAPNDGLLNRFPHRIAGANSKTPVVDFRSISPSPQYSSSTTPLCPQKIPPRSILPMLQRQRSLR